MKLHTDTCLTQGNIKQFKKAYTSINMWGSGYPLFAELQKPSSHTETYIPKLYFKLSQVCNITGYLSRNTSHSVHKPLT